MATTPSPFPHDPTRPPACSWRGLLIDSTRTFWPVPVMELIITVMARYRLNILHWHLTDNAGWRLPVPGYPALTSVGAQIPRDPAHWYDRTCAPQRSGTWRTSPAHTTQGFYSDANIRHLVRFAAQRDVSIIPEISIPSAAGATIRAYPHLGNPDLVSPPKRTTQRCGPSPHPSNSSRQPSTTRATYSPPPSSISVSPGPTGASGNAIDGSHGLVSARDKTLSASSSTEPCASSTSMAGARPHGTWQSTPTAAHHLGQSSSPHATAEPRTRMQPRRAPHGYSQTPTCSPSTTPQLTPRHPSPHSPRASSLISSRQCSTASDSKASRPSPGPLR